jgi:hypothetical protein
VIAQPTPATLTGFERDGLARVADDLAFLLYGSGVRAMTTETGRAAWAVVTATSADERDRAAHLRSTTAQTSDEALAALVLDMATSFAEYVTAARVETRAAGAMGIEAVAHKTGVACGLTCDPTADAAERWLCSVGLDCIAAGGSPERAIQAAILDLDNPLGGLSF